MHAEANKSENGTEPNIIYNKISGILKAPFSVTFGGCLFFPPGPLVSLERGVQLFLGKSFQHAILLHAENMPIRKKIVLKIMNKRFRFLSTFFKNVPWNLSTL